MPRLLLLSTTTGYQTRAFGQAAAALGIEVVFATDRCHLLDDPWRDGAIAVRFHEPAASVRAIVAAAGARPFDGVLALGDRPAVLAAQAAEALALPGHPPAAVVSARDKRLARARFREAGLPVPWTMAAAVTDDPAALGAGLPYPVVIKPTVLSASRGVMRADTPEAFVAAFARLRALLDAPDVRETRDEATAAIQVERFVPGAEYAVEAVLEHGRARVLAIFDKPDPLDGPFFEETIYLTPTRAPRGTGDAVVEAVLRAARALGLSHGPIHGECRVNDEGVFVLEVAARPIGGLCARALRFTRGAGETCGLEALLARHAVGEALDGWRREAPASGVMMIPIPRGGVFKGVAGVAAAAAVPGVEEVTITAKPDQVLVPLPEGASYLGFIFARGPEPAGVDAALRAAHAALAFDIAPAIAVRTAAGA
ncbi:MAG: acetyl-CoA carboxylase biotin carboxylase subunit family protein [Vicinamibacterales bacterium]